MMCDCRRNDPHGPCSATCCKVPDYAPKEQFQFGDKLWRTCWTKVQSVIFCKYNDSVSGWCQILTSEGYVITTPTNSLFKEKPKGKVKKEIHGFLCYGNHRADEPKAIHISHGDSPSWYSQKPAVLSTGWEMIPAVITYEVEE